MPSHDPFIGTKLSSYEVLQAIGEGGMARVYRAKHTELKSYAAIKVVNWGLQEDPDFTVRFYREAQTLASLHHSNIVQFLDFGKHESGYFIVMQFVEGQDLAVLLQGYTKRGALLPKDDIIRIIKDVAEALDYAHEQGVIHRDVKPSNIMLTPNGRSILTDFGLAMLPTQKSQATLGNTFGTPFYIAPEQAISSAAAVAASDLYSLGVILYEMTTGRVPFEDESPLSVALKHVSDAPPPPRSINPELPIEVEKVILKTLAKTPTDRFASAKDMAAALEVAWTNPGAYFAPATIPLPIRLPPTSQTSDFSLPVTPSSIPFRITLPNPPVPIPVPPSSTPKQSNISSFGLLVAAGILGGLMVFIPTYLISQGWGISRSTPTAVAVITNNSSDFTLPSNTPTATSSPTPTNTATPTATSTPTNTATLPPPTDTPTAPPTATPLPPTDTPTATATFIPKATLPPATATLAPNGLLTIDQLRGKILFKTDRDGNTALYRMDANGSNQVSLSNENWNLYTQLQANLPNSADGLEQIVPLGEGQLDLWLVNLGDGSRRRVTSTGRNEFDAAWSPINRQVAYVSEETGNGDIYVINLGGSANDRLTINGDDLDRHPTWSPDGRQIAFWSDRGVLHNRQIWLLTLDTQETKSLSDNPFNDFDPIWVR